MRIRLFEDDPKRYREIQTGLLRLGIPLVPKEREESCQAILVGRPELLRQGIPAAGDALLFCLAETDGEKEGVRFVSSVGEMVHLLEQQASEEASDQLLPELTKYERIILRCLAEAGDKGETKEGLADRCLIPKGGQTPGSLVTHIGHINRKALRRLGYRLIEHREGRYRLTENERGT